MTWDFFPHEKVVITTLKILQSLHSYQLSGSFSCFTWFSVSLFFGILKILKVLRPSENHPKNEKKTVKFTDNEI